MTASDLFPRAWHVRVDTLDVSALDIEFKILRSIKSTPNKCSLTVYNLNEDHRAQLLKRNRPTATPTELQRGFAHGKLVGVSVQVEAGYGDRTPILFAGDLREVVSVRDGNNWKTMLAGDDGGRAHREARFPNGGIQFTKGTLVGTVLQQCAGYLGIGVGNVADFAATAEILGVGSTLPHSMTLSGSVSKELQRVVASVGLTYSIQNGVLQVQRPGVPLQLAAIRLTPTTGLLGSPEVAIDSTVGLGNIQQFAVGGVQKTAKPPKPKSTSVLKLKAMLIPGMVPGRKIVLESAAFTGSYTLSEVESVGQSWSNLWEHNCVARVYP